LLVSKESTKRNYVRKKISKTKRLSKPNEKPARHNSKCKNSNISKTERPNKKLAYNGGPMRRPCI